MLFGQDLDGFAYDLSENIFLEEKNPEAPEHAHAHATDRENTQATTNQPLRTTLACGEQGRGSRVWVGGPTWSQSQGAEGGEI